MAFFFSAFSFQTGTKASPFVSYRLFKTLPQKRSCHPIAQPGWGFAPFYPSGASPGAQHLCEVTGAIPTRLEKAGIVKPRPIKGKYAATPGPAGSEPRLAVSSVLAGKKLGEDGSWEKSRGGGGLVQCPNYKTRKKQSFIPDHSEFLKFGAIQKQPNKNIVLGSKELFCSAASQDVSFFRSAIASLLSNFSPASASPKATIQP